MTRNQRDELQVWMPGAFARLGPVLAAEFTAASGQPIAFAPFKPSGRLAAGILAGETADVYVSANVQRMRRLQPAEMVRHWATLARNRLCLVTMPDAGVEGLTDLTVRDSRSSHRRRRPTHGNNLLPPGRGHRNLVPPREHAVSSCSIGRQMLRDVSLTVSLVVALLLMVLTPVGTGQGVHRDQLLDPLFPHVHFADGSTLLLRNPQRVVESRGQGPSLGAEAGAASASLSMGLTPTVPGGLLLLPPTDSLWRHVPLTAGPHEALSEPPPDPPPNFA